ncbi:MAG TPA: hypothetical protein VG940_12170 [Gemmatimonadales bacterium]|nr:hypothetical protein [Gemmatimonadales bacterium]
MKNIWLKIGLGAGGIFAVGMVLVSLVKAGRNKIEDLVHSDADIRIPLMGIVPFQLADQRLGDLRRVTLLRDAPKHLTGVRVEVRLADSATIDPLKDCQFLTVNDPTHLNERTRFTCVADSAGLSSFGTVEIRHRQGDEPTTLVRTLVLAPADLAALQADMGPRVGPDSAQLAALELMGDSLRAMGDSIRAATMVQVRIAEQQARSARAGRVRVEEIPAPPSAPSAPGARSTPAPTP